MALSPSAVQSAIEKHAIFGVWLNAINLSDPVRTARDVPYLRGTQAVVQWQDIQTVPDVFNFSELDNQATRALASIPSGEDAPPFAQPGRFTVQVNGNLHPVFFFDMLPSNNNNTKIWAHENQDARGVLQFWHPYFIDQYRYVHRS